MIEVGASPSRLFALKLIVLGFLNEWPWGAFAAGPAGLGAVAALSSGRSWHFARRKEWTLNRYGFHKVVDYRFSTRDVNVPLDHVMKMAGWRQTLDAESKGALVMGILGLSAIPLVPLAFLITWLVER